MAADSTDIKEEPAFIARFDEQESTALISPKKMNFKGQGGALRKSHKTRTHDLKNNSPDASIFHWARDCPEKEDKTDLQSDAKNRRPKTDDDRCEVFLIFCVVSLEEKLLTVFFPYF